MNLSTADQQVLTRQLTDLSRAVEELLLTGLTAASEATRQTLEVTFREASRLRLLRLASTLRGANEEVGRFVGQQDEFSGKRLSFFLNRAWLLAQGMLQAIRTSDAAAWSRLMWTAATTPVELLQVVTLGVAKKMAKGSFCAFEFRLREVAGAMPSRLVWSCVFPLKPDNVLPAEAFLQLPQKQKFKTSIFLEPTVLTITNVLVSADEYGGGRVTLTDASTVTAGEAFEQWNSLQDWSPEPLLHRLKQHVPSPFDLEVELQDEVVLDDWTIGVPRPARDGQITFPLTWQGLEMDCVVPAGPDGDAARTQLDTLQKSDTRPPLFGLLHFDRARFILQPLATILETGPNLLTISTARIDHKALLKSLKF
ncbi:MAG: hypothetical protein JSS49_05255 [Planctomycetes bacterium]|nr:hypothetical protein [Planctomycetota bacterium]